MRVRLDEFLNSDTVKISPKRMRLDDFLSPEKAQIEEHFATLSALTPERKSTLISLSPEQEDILNRSFRERKTSKNKDYYSGSTPQLDAFAQGFLPVRPQDWIITSEKHPVAEAVGKVAGLITTGALTGNIAPFVTFSEPLAALPTVAKFAAGRMAQSGVTFGLKELSDNMAEILSGDKKSFGVVVKDTLMASSFGVGLGAVGAIPSPVMRIPAEATYGFVTAKLAGSDNMEAGINAGIFAVFGLFNTKNLTEAYKKAAYGGAKQAFIDKLMSNGYAPDKAKNIADRFFEWAINKNGGWQKQKIEDFDKFSQAMRKGWKIIVEPEIKAEVRPEVKPQAQIESKVTPTPETLKAVTPQVKPTGEGKIDPLIAEAKKYKSAEEFVKAQGTPVYHGTNVDFEQIGFGKGVRQTMLSDRYEDRPAIFFSPKKSDAEFFAQNRAEYFEDKGIKGGKQRVIEAYLDIKNPADFTTAKKADAVLDKAGISYDNEILGIDDVGTTVEDEISSGRAKLSELAMILDNPKNIKKLQDAGFDGAVLLESEQYGLGKSYAVFNPKQIKTKSQLIDIWNKANTPTQPQAGEMQRAIQGTGETKKRGLSFGVEAKAIENKLTDSFGELPEYQAVNMKEQATKAQELLTNDHEKAKRIAMGEELPPNDIIPESVFVAVENKAVKEGDVATLKDLATSSGLTAEATIMGQRIRTLAERDPESPVTAIKEVVKAREDVAQKRLKTKKVGDAKKKAIKEVKESIRKHTSTKQDWADFVRSLQC